MPAYGFRVLTSVFSRLWPELCQSVTGFSILLLAVIWLAAFQVIETERVTLQRDLAKDTANLAIVLEQNVARLVSEIDRTIKFLRTSYERNASQVDWPTLIKDEYALSDQTVQIAIIDKQGIMITSTAMLYPPSPVDLSDREHFKVHVRSQRDELFISKPILGRASGRWSVQFTRGFKASDGNFGGVIVVSLDPAHLSKAYGKLDLGERSGLAVVGSDGIIRAGSGSYAGWLGRGLVEGTRLKRLDNGQTDTTLAYEDFNGATQIVAFRSVKGYPLEVTVADRHFEQDRLWRRTHRTYLFGATIASIMILGALVLAGYRRRRHEAQLVHLARHDVLTGLANRVQFRAGLETALAGLSENRDFALHLIDLDGFKFVNDKHGHPVGDRLLREVADRLRASLRHCDLASRLGGDEFAVIQSNLQNPMEAVALARRVCEILSNPYDIDGKRLAIGASIGIALGQETAHSTKDLMKSADVALYTAKSSGRGCYRFYDSAMDIAARTRREIEVELKVALARQQFELFYQPIIEIGSGQTTGYEALLRWRHPQRGLILPGEFISIAEESGLIDPIGAWVVQQACADMANRPSHLRVAVNCSAVQFKGDTLWDAVRKALQSSQLAAHQLEIEITESMLMHKDTATVEQLEKLNALGVHIAMDDFGTGFSCLSYLQTYPINRMKIDRSFVAALGAHNGASAIIRAIVMLAASLNMTTVAEGVETAEQLRELERLGCTEAQGYYFSRPLPASEILPVLGEVRPAAEAA